MSIDPIDDEDSGDEGHGAGRATPLPGSNKSPSRLSDVGEASRSGDPAVNNGERTSGMSVSILSVYLRCWHLTFIYP